MNDMHHTVQLPTGKIGEISYPHKICEKCICVHLKSPFNMDTYKMIL